MKGGYQIIDIRKLNLTLSNVTHSITDAEILEQLRSLRAYIQKGHDFTKPLDNALKCIQIRYRDQKNGEKLEACQWANIESSNNSLTYEIKTKNLMIEVVFEEKTDEYENKYYDIKTAKYLYNLNEIVEGNLDIAHDLTVGGDIEGEGKITANEIVEKMSGYSFVPITAPAQTYPNLKVIYAGACKNGNKLTLVMFMSFTYDIARFLDVGKFIVPSDIYSKLYPYDLDSVAVLDVRSLDLITQRQSVPAKGYGEIFKAGNNEVVFSFATPSGLVASNTYIVRYEATFLLSENLAPQE